MAIRLIAQGFLRSDLVAPLVFGQVQSLVGAVEHVAQAAHHVGEQRQIVFLQAGATVGDALEGVFERAGELLRCRQARGAGDAGERVCGAHGCAARRSLWQGLRGGQLGVEGVEMLRRFGAIEVVERAREFDVADLDRRLVGQGEFFGAELTAAWYKNENWL